MNALQLNSLWRTIIGGHDIFKTFEALRPQQKKKTMSGTIIWSNLLTQNVFLVSCIFHPLTDATKKKSIMFTSSVVGHGVMLETPSRLEGGGDPPLIKNNSCFQINYFKWHYHEHCNKAKVWLNCTEMAKLGSLFQAIVRNQKRTSSICCENWLNNATTVIRSTLCTSVT